MAIDINEQVSNAYNAAKQALNDDLKQDLYNATIARTTAFRQLNNTANAKHALFSGTPAAAQMQYDSSTYLPGIKTAAVANMEKAQNNQETWDEYMDYINQLNEQAAQYNSYAEQARAATQSYRNSSYALQNAMAGYKTSTPKNVYDSYAGE